MTAWQRFTRPLAAALRDVQPAATLALAAATASTGVIIPVLKPLVEETGHGTGAASLFTAVHVLGGVVGAVFGARALRRVGSARRLAAIALSASIAVTLAMAAASSLELRIALRFLDGGCHLLAITALVAIATAGDADQRMRRAVIAGEVIVLGLASGLGIGTRFPRPSAALTAAAVMSAIALVVVLTRVATSPVPAAVRRSRGRAPLAPGLLAFCERFSFGSMTVAIPMLTTPGRVGLVIGVLMTASAIALAAAWSYAPRLGPRKLAVRGALGFTLALAVCAAVDILPSIPLAAAWAIVAGGASGSIYAAALVLATRSAEIEDRARGMGTVHAAGSAGHALGALSVGALHLALPGMLMIAVPGIAVIAAAAIGVWLTVPDAAKDCPVIRALDADSSQTSSADPAPR